MAEQFTLSYDGPDGMSTTRRPHADVPGDVSAGRVDGLRRCGVGYPDGRKGFAAAHGLQVSFDQVRVWYPQKCRVSR